VGEHPGESGAERVGQPGPVDVEALQIYMEVLAWAVHPVVGPGLLARGPVAAELGQVGEDLQQFHLALERAPAQFRAGGQVVGEQPTLVAGVDVVAEEQAA